MRKVMKLTWVIAFGLGLAVSSPLAAQQKQGQEQQGPPAAREAGEQGDHAFGTVTSVGVDRFEIKRRDGTALTILVGEQTHLRQGQQDIQLEDLKPGDRVMVSGTTNTQKEFVAANVRRITEEEAQRFQNASERAFGEIVAIDNNQIKVRNPRTGERTVIVNDQTVLMNQGQPITLKDLKVGDRIFALGKETQGQFVATRIFTGQFRPGQFRREEQKH